MGHICITLDDLPVVVKAFCCIGFCAGSFLGNFHDVLYLMLGSIFRKMLEVRIIDGFRYRWKIQIGLPLIFLLFGKIPKKRLEVLKRLWCPCRIQKAGPFSFIRGLLKPSYFRDYGTAQKYLRKNLTIYRPFYLFSYPKKNRPRSPIFKNFRLGKCSFKSAPVDPEQKRLCFEGSAFFCKS